jgi:hypothetical protein
MRTLLLFLASLFFLAETAHAQSYTTDSTAVFFFRAEVADAINPRHPKPYFDTEAHDDIYRDFMTIISDSLGIKPYTISFFEKKQQKHAFFEYPSLRLKDALKKRKAAYFLKVGIRFEPIGKVSSNNETKISIGVVGGKTKSNQQRLRMLTEFVLHDSTGAVVKKVTSSVDSEEMINLRDVDGLDVSGVAALAKSKGKRAEEKPSPLLNLVKAGAAATVTAFKAQ